MNKDRWSASERATARYDEFLRRTGTLPQNISWGIKADYALSLLGASASAPERTRDEAIELVRELLCYIEATRPRAEWRQIRCWDVRGLAAALLRRAPAAASGNTTVLESLFKHQGVSAFLFMQGREQVCRRLQAMFSFVANVRARPTAVQHTCSLAVAGLSAMRSLAMSVPMIGRLCCAETLLAAMLIAG